MKFGTTTLRSPAAQPHYRRRARRRGAGAVPAHRYPDRIRAYGDICNISEIVRQIKDAGKIAIVHADLISGLAAKEISVDFLRRSTQADGVISTRANMIQRAKELNMIAILRVFLIDSMALDSALSAKNLKPDAIDILPGLMPSMLRKVRQLTGLPILTGGLITEKKEVMQALEAGALAISSTAPAVWQM